MSRTKQTLWILWLITCSASSVFIGYGGCAHAQDLKTQVVTNVKCPETALCTKNENGIWIPMWYARDLLEVRAQFEGIRKDLASANEEIAQLRIANAEHVNAEEALESVAAAEKRTAEIFENRATTAETKSNRRLRWAVSSSIASAVVISILSAVVATH